MKEYKSKVSYGILIPVLVLLVGITLLPIYSGEPEGTIVSIIAVLIPVSAFVLHLFFNTSYQIKDDKQLLITCGFLYHSAIDIKSIHSIRPSRSIISAPAASLDRIKLKYGRWDSVIISPENKQQFIKELQTINPDIELIKD
ncbi:PH domain-containing protein [Reichenbachiella ulvae]|uniref:PH domain-containing protein n=1 Tax=Reichenbachiella ulvae TaxID=2980104 RepID=A0ABT3CTT6_9BACT|nr:PH domain-containing protein [Reichenbachiella ulvae]MCV9387047.1 PH domain-containing protein [Reichenbachiella ulvae]